MPPTSLSEVAKKGFPFTALLGWTDFTVSRKNWMLVFNRSSLNVGAISQESTSAHQNGKPETQLLEVLFKLSCYLIFPHKHSKEKECWGSSFNPVVNQSIKMPDFLCRNIVKKSFKCLLLEEQRFESWGNQRAIYTDLLWGAHKAKVWKQISQTGRSTEPTKLTHTSMWTQIDYEYNSAS